MGDHAERIWGQLVSANFFDVLQVTPSLGRSFRPDEEAEGAGPVAVISDALWRRRFSSSADAIGQTIQLNGHALTIVGVAPPGFHGVMVGLLLDVWVPVGMQPLIGGGAPNRLGARDVRWLGAYARLSRGSSLESLGGELRAAGDRLARDHPGTNEGASFTATTLADAPWGGTTAIRPVLTVLMVVVIVVLVVTCANVAILLLVRAVGRRREMATRLALGARRGRLTRQLIVESLLLAGMAGAAGVAASLLSVGLFKAFLPPTGFPVGFDFTVDLRWLLAALAISSAAGLLFGLAPAMQAWSTPIVQVLREESTAALGGGQPLARRVLAAAQVALAAALMSIAGILATSLDTAANIDPGFDTEHTLIGSVDLSHAGYSAERGRVFIRTAIDELGQLPGVRGVSVARRIPLNFGGRGLVPATIDGYTPGRGEDVSLALNVVGPDYLRTMAIPLLSGREFSTSDSEQAERVAIINAAAARRYWKDVDPIGRRLVLGGATARVIGIAGDIRQDQLTQEPFPAALLPVLQEYRPDLVFHLSAVHDPAPFAAEMRRVLAGIDASLPLYDVRTIRAHMQVPTFQYRLGAVLTGVFSAFALLLAGLGLYAVIAHAVAERRTEIGLRLALGASRSEIARLVAGTVATLVLVGAMLGVFIGAAVARSAAAQLPGIDANAIGSYVSVADRHRRRRRRGCGPSGLARDDGEPDHRVAAVAPDGDTSGRR